MTPQTVRKKHQFSSLLRYDWGNKNTASPARHAPYVGMTVGEAAPTRTAPLHNGEGDDGSGAVAFWKLEMADILTDYREWVSQQEERIGTHSDDCHLWPRHERCMIHRLARELERTRAALVAVATQDGTLSVSEGRLFVDANGVEELAFDFDTLRPHRTPGEGSEPKVRSV